MIEKLVIPSEIRTKRLILRMPNPIYAPAIYEAIVESNLELSRWLSWANQEITLEQAFINAQNAQEAFLSKNDLRYYMFDASDNFIGSTGLHRIDWNIPKFEIGFWVRTSAAGQGYVTEAVNGLTALAFQKFNANRVEIRCDENHMKSRAIAEKTGFLLEGILRNDTMTPEGKLRNTAVYSRIEGWI
ncbi:GNAT family N-acetyltransferase [Paenibacillus terreus]|uniref:GNAT family N-acetyltransferase n=1 Tax=Paenibacillus terreus TaxID=1387834 RepID=A0ABV5BDT6_9BACL